MDSVSILFASRSTDSNFNGGCDYAILTLTKEEAEILLKMHTIFMKAFRTSESNGLRRLMQMEFMDYGPEWYSHGPWVDEIDEDLLARIDEGTPEQIDRNRVPKEELEQQVECRTVHVSETGFEWEASPKHSDIWLKTSELSLDTVRACLAGPLSH